MKEHEKSILVKKIYHKILPPVQKALENGDYKFTAKNSIRIYTLDGNPFDEATISSIDITWS